MALDVHMFACLTDNYGFLIHDRASGMTASIDSPDVDGINRALSERGWRLTHILNTHHHFDHAGGNRALKDQWQCDVVGYGPDADRLPGLSRAVQDNEWITLGASRAQVLAVPGHTLGHIAYHFPDEQLVFVGDTLFALGCGRLFEGTPAQMWASLNRLMALPDETRVYCAHEYTLANAEFALTVEPDNPALQERYAEITRLRAARLPTVPTSIGQEKATNPFLRASSTDLQRTLGQPDHSLVDVFAETRRRKDNF